MYLKTFVHGLESLSPFATEWPLIRFEVGLVMEEVKLKARPDNNLTLS